MSRFDGTIAERFEHYNLPEPNSGCWLWIGTYDHWGYGVLNVGPKKRKAHQISHELFKGPSRGLHVLHQCDLPCCVNPDHLYLGTDQDNANDRVRRGRQPDHVGTTNPNAVLTEKQVLAIRTDSRPQQAVANDYSISIHSVSAIKRRLNWKHLKDSAQTRGKRG